jgi:hypothetical protein
MKSFKEYRDYTSGLLFAEEAIAGNFELRTIWARDNFDRFKKKAIAGDLLDATGKTKFKALSAQGKKELIPFLDSLEKDVPEGKNNPDRIKLMKLIRYHIAPLSKIAKMANGFSGKAGSTPSGAQWEALAVLGIRADNNIPFMDSLEWKDAGKFWVDYERQARILGKNFGDMFGVNDMVQWGHKKKIKTNSDWQPAKNKTPKTDIVAGAYRISLKKHGGSQLMSGGPAEATATLNAAMTTYSISTEGRKVVEKVIDDIHTKMGKMSEKGEISALDARIAAAKKSGKKLSTMDAKLKKELGHLRVNAQELTTDLGKIFKDKDLKAHFCWEAATGQTKFGNNGTHGAIANELVTFKPTGTLSNRLKLDKPLVAGAVLAKGNDFYVSFKTGGGSPSYLALRTHKAKIDPSLQTTGYIPTFKTILAEELEREGLLTESHINLLQLDEFALWNNLKKKAKTIGLSILNKAKKIFNAVMQRLTQAFNAIKKLGSRMINALLNFFNFEIKKIRIRSGGPYPLT